MKPKKVILLPHGARTQLAIEFKVSRITVNNALNFMTYSPLAKKLRAAALQRGGCAYQPPKY